MAATQFAGTGQLLKVGSGLGRAPRLSRVSVPLLFCKVTGIGHELHSVPHSAPLGTAWSTEPHSQFVWVPLHLHQEGPGFCPDWPPS